jgi:hypothetical protein
MPVRNEAWILGASLRAALAWCDEVIVLNHASTDNTEEIVCEVMEEHQGRVVLIGEPCASWSEMNHRQRLLEEARSRKATHIALVDADEILTGNLVYAIRDTIERLPAGGTAQVGMLAMWRGLDRYRVGNSIWANRFDLTLAFRDHPSLSWQAIDGYDHHQRAPLGSKRAFAGHSMEGGVMHLQWASWRRLVAKHARYKMDERLKYPNKPTADIDAMYSLALDERGLQVAFTPPDWWASYQRLLPYIDLNAEPWQEQQCKSWMEQHGAEKFKGLDLFGVC